MSRWSIYALLIFLASPLFFSCKKKKSGKSEGLIEYAVSYPKMDKDNFMLDFLPKTMTQKFSNNTLLSELSAGMGMFRTCFIMDSNDKKYTHFVKLLNKKYVLVLDQDEVDEMNKLMPDFKVTFTDETKEIAGFKCKKAIITIDSHDNETFDIYYTEEIDFDEPNWATQYANIKGVLMEYQVEKYGLCMRMQATRVSYEKIEDESLKMPEGYQFVSRDRMDKEMEEIFQSFNQ